MIFFFLNQKGPMHNIKNILISKQLHKKKSSYTLSNTTKGFKTILHVRVIQHSWSFGAIHQIIWTYIRDKKKNTEKWQLVVVICVCIYENEEPWMKFYFVIYGLWFQIWCDGHCFHLVKQIIALLLLFCVQFCNQGLIKCDSFSPSDDVIDRLKRTNAMFLGSTLSFPSRRD